MARKRMIDPALWLSEDFSKLSIMARLIWIGLISQADDEGRGRANPVYIKSTLFAYDEDMGLSKITKALNEIMSVMSISVYEVDGKRYYQLENWDKFQTINRPTPSQIPPKNGASKDIHGTLTEYSLNAHGVLTNNSLPNRKEIEIEEEKERNPLKGVKKESTHPTKDDVIAYAKSRDRLDLAVKFWEYYEAGNWKDVTGATVKNWKQKFLTWCNKQPKPNNSVIIQETYTKDEFDGVFDEFKEMEV